MLPLSHKNDTPDHYCKGIDKIRRAVISRVLEHNITDESEDSDDGGNNQPFLEEGDEGEICLRVRPNVL